MQVKNMISWNTGRLYSENGQRIGAGILAGRVVFYDLDRGIYGLLSDDIQDVRPGTVLYRYDNGCYSQGIPEGATPEDVREFKDTVAQGFGEHNA